MTFVFILVSILLPSLFAYIAFFAGLFVLTILAFRKLSMFWKVFSALLWAIILMAHLATGFVSPGLDYFILASTIVGVSIVGFVLPFASVSPIIKSLVIDQLLGTSSSTLVLTRLIVGYVTIGILALGAISGMEFVIVIALFSLCFLVFLSALLRTKNVPLFIGIAKSILLVVGLILFVLSFAALMSFGIFSLPLALLFLASGIILQVATDKTIDRKPIARSS